MADTAAILNNADQRGGAVLLPTKLFMPQVEHQTDLLPRPRLVERLQGGLTRKLTLVSAPAGYGKTMLLAQWLPHA